MEIDTTNGQLTGYPVDHSQANGGSTKDRVDINTLEHGGNLHDLQPGAKNGQKDDISQDHNNNNNDKIDSDEIDPVGFFQLFRFCTRLDVLLIILATLGSIGHGAAFPTVVLLIGNIVDSFIELGSVTNNMTTNTTEFSIPEEDIVELSITYVYVGLCVVVVAFLQGAFWTLTAERQVHNIRLHFFNSILHQDITWFDAQKSGDLASRFSDDIAQIQTGIGEKLGTILQYTTTCIGGLILGFVKSWELALVILSFVGVIILPATTITARFTRRLTQRELGGYGKAGSIAEEVLSAIRTVVAFGGEEKESKRYYKNLHHAKRQGIKKDTLQGLYIGIFQFGVYGCYSLAFWYGTRLVLRGDISAGDIFVVFISVLFGFFSLGNAAPNFADVSTARGAAALVWKIIDRKSEIDSSCDEGLQPKTMTGQISFTNVHFAYPSRKDIKILDCLSLQVNVGETVALVGASGNGKSTVVRLVQRLYDIDDGNLEIDGNDIKELNVNWLRRHIGIVDQEPVLFATSIQENIRYGRIDASNDDIVQAAKEANAHDFISALPDGYNTLVGDRGVKLSGGQKQRIAIARALLRDPEILLLDEATSALDTESESLVQGALDKAKIGRTTIVIAHRLSTIKNADVICVFDKGRIVEKGKHEDLLEIPDGIYKQLATGKLKEGNDNASRREDKVMDIRDVTKSVDKPDVTGVNEEEQTEESAELKKQHLNDLMKNFSVRRIMKMNSPESLYIIIGIIASAFAGGVSPAYSYLFSRIIATFAIQDTDELNERIRFLCGMFLVLATTALISNILQNAAFGKSGEELTLRLRHLSFKAMLRQNIAWFDDDQNSIGILTTRLSTETSEVKGITGVRIGLIFQALCNMGVAIIIALYFGWQLTLAVLGFLPLLAAASAVNWKLMKDGSVNRKEELEQAGKLVLESVVNIRTVVSLTRENVIYGNFKSILKDPYMKSQKNSIITGVTFAFAQIVIYFAYAAVFRFGGYLVGKGLMEFQNMFLVFGAIVFGGFGLGRVIGAVPDYGKAKISACHIFKLLDRSPPIDSYSNDGSKPESFTPIVQFKDVYFKYPTRPKVQVLRGLSVSVTPGETLALVGSSGCGKSTTVNLTERLYDPLQGSVYLDQFDVKDLNIQWLRSQMGLVSQEPVLFDGTIAYNIAYGDNTRDVPLTEIIECAKKANIHNFIEKLPLGYDTNVGERGTQLSGGQKQRIAIARALVRNPKLLLLDEATSALDSESEKVVQDALNEAKKGRTCITIAHRLSTIHDADKIAVIQRGVVAELGTHEELMERKGQYYSLYTAQELKT
ncbi:ATP-dependent translocase ABCB1-like [Amphiura filiformis]|uniref:ATP-dependent translocase ABCB1-like n=1 Tax=Amphiura filiformis TaxID=82378 RepID=UPI003B210A6F